MPEQVIKSNGQNHIHQEYIYKKKKTLKLPLLKYTLQLCKKKRKRKKKKKRLEEGRIKISAHSSLLKHIDDKLKAIFKIPSPPILHSSDKINVFGKEHNKTTP